MVLRGGKGPRRDATGFQKKGKGFSSCSKTVLKVGKGAGGWGSKHFQNCYI